MNFVYFGLVIIGLMVFSIEFTSLKLNRLEEKLSKMNQELDETKDSIETATFLENKENSDRFLSSGILPPTIS